MLTSFPFLLKSTLFPLLTTTGYPKYLEMTSTDKLPKPVLATVFSKLLMGQPDLPLDTLSHLCSLSMAHIHPEDVATAA